MPLAAKTATSRAAQAGQNGRGGKYTLRAGVAALQAQFARPRAVPEMLRLGCRLRPRASSFGHRLLSVDVIGSRLCRAAADSGNGRWAGPLRVTVAGSAAIFILLAGSKPMAEERVERRLGGDPLRRCRRIFAADGRGRGKNARRPQEPPPGTDRSADRPTPRAHLQDHRRRHPDRVRLGRRCRALRRRGAAGHGGSQRQSAGERAHPLSYRHQPRRRHGRRRRHVRRRRQCRGAAPGDRRSPARSASAPRCASKLGRSCRSGLPIWASTASRILRGRCAFTASKSAPHRPTLRPTIGPTRRSRLPETTLARSAAVHQYERRSRAGIFRRRHRRGHHYRAVADQMALSSSPAIRPSSTRAGPSM